MGKGPQMGGGGGGNNGPAGGYHGEVFHQMVLSEGVGPQY